MLPKMECWPPGEVISETTAGLVVLVESVLIWHFKSKWSNNYQPHSDGKVAAVWLVSMATERPSLPSILWGSSGSSVTAALRSRWHVLVSLMCSFNHQQTQSFKTLPELLLFSRVTYHHNHHLHLDITNILLRLSSRSRSHNRGKLRKWF